MYLPKFKYKTPRYTQGRDYFLPGGKPYIGWFFETYKGEFYTGKEPSKDSKRLTSYTPSYTNDPKWPNILTTTIFTPQIVIPNEADRKKGYFIRYFLQDKRNKKIIEVDFTKYTEYKDLVYISSLELHWIIKGPAESIEWKGYIYEGAASKNRKAVEEAEKEFTNLSQQIKSYDQFVE